MNPWLSLAWLAGSLALLVPVTRWFGNGIRALVLLPSGNTAAALYLHFALLLPGTLLHEVSHWLAANLLGVRTGRMQIGPQPTATGAVRFGALEYVRPDPLRESLIGVAPLLSGAGVVLMVASWRLHLAPRAIVDLPSALDAARRAAAAQDAWVWVYLIVAVANAMLPSPADRRGWPPVLLCLGVLLVVLLLTGALAHLPVGASAFVAALTARLAFAFTLTIALDLIVGLALWTVVLALGLLLNRRIVTC